MGSQRVAKSDGTSQYFIIKTSDVDLGISFYDSFI